MIETFKKKLIALKDNLTSVIEKDGGMKVFITTIIVVLIIWPFVLLYYFLLKPMCKFIRMIFDINELGLRSSYQKSFHSKEYKVMEHEKKEALKEPLLPAGRQKQFNERENWPDAYVVNGNAVYAAGGRTLLFVDESVTEFEVPEGVENIYHRCFACCDALKRVTIPSSVKRIGNRAFFCCVSLREVVIPDSVSIIEEELFMNCSSLERVELPSHTSEIPARTFCNCRRLKHFKLPEGVRVIGEEAFRRCYSLEDIEINEQLETIAKRAFEECRLLKEFIMPNSVRACSEGMFNGCHSLEHIHFSSQIKDFGGSCCRDCWNIKQLSMPVDEHMIAYAKEKWEEYSDEIDISKSENPVPESMFWTMNDALFFGIPRLTSVCLMFCFSKEVEYTIPSFVSNIKRDAFTSCKNLRTLRLSPYIKTSCDPWEHESISYSFIYEYWSQIENVIFDEALKHSKYAFGLIA